MIVGSGFTGSRVSGLLRARDCRVTALRSADIDFRDPGAVDRLRAVLTAKCVVLHSVPSLAGGADRILLDGLDGLAARVVYLSTAGVYGSVVDVDEHTPALGPHERLATEQAVQTGPWESLIIRPGAIYGPGRGVQVALREGRYKPRGILSRIHVYDLAAITAAALLSNLTGAFPAADEYPCSSDEVAAFCAARFGLVAPPRDPEISTSLVRRIDGSAILRQLGIRLRYPSFREGLAGNLDTETET